MTDSHLSPAEAAAPYAVAIDGIGHGAAAGCTTLDEAISVARRLSMDALFIGDTVRVSGPDGIAAVVIGGVLFRPAPDADH